jgi:hypothetical protein
LKDLAAGGNGFSAGYEVQQQLPTLGRQQDSQPPQQSEPQHPQSLPPQASHPQLSSPEIPLSRRMPLASAALMTSTPRWRVEPSRCVSDPCPDIIPGVMGTKNPAEPGVFGSIATEGGTAQPGIASPPDKKLTGVMNADAAPAGCACMRFM